MCPVDFGDGRRRAEAASVSVQLQHAVQGLQRHLPAYRRKKQQSVGGAKAQRMTKKPPRK